MERFTAILGGTDGERPTVELPFDARERFGRARAPVRGTVNGTSFRTTVAVYGGRQLIGFRKELRDAAGIAIGDKVRVEVELDDTPRTVAVPPELESAFAAAPDARAAFDGLSYTHRREYAVWVGEAKRGETRLRRTAKAVAMLQAGERTPVSLTQYYTATTLDGFIADPDHSLDWLFTRKHDDDGPLNYGDFFAQVGAMAMGRTTYEWILDHEFAGKDPADRRWPYEIPCWVFTHRELPVVTRCARRVHERERRHRARADGGRGR